MARKKTPETNDIEKKLDVADSALTKFGIILKKHWGKLLLILFGYLTYQFCILVKESMDQDAAMENEIQAEETFNAPIEDDTAYDSTEYYYTDDDTVPQ